MTMKHWILVSKPCCVVVIHPDNSFQEVIVIFSVTGCSLWLDLITTCGKPEKKQQLSKSIFLIYKTEELPQVSLRFISGSLHLHNCCGSNQTQAELWATSVSAQTWNHFWHRRPLSVPYNMAGLVSSLPARISPYISNKSHLLHRDPNRGMGNCQTKNSLIQQGSYVRTSSSLTCTQWAEPKTSELSKRPGTAENEGEYLCAPLMVV